MKVSHFILFMGLIAFTAGGQSKALVFQSDFGVKDGAVSAMKGVAYGISHDLALFDLTHEIPAYNIWEAAYRLDQTVPYWPSGTVFVSVVDPGVGSSRKSIVLKTNSGHYIVTPDNGTITLIAERLGVAGIREIDEEKNRRKDSKASYTFHGRDVYAYTGARLAAGIISFEQVGPPLTSSPVTINYEKPRFENGKLSGTIDILDIQYGNLWTNIAAEELAKLQVKPGDFVQVRIFHSGKVRYEGSIEYGRTFADVAVGSEVVYLNSLLRLSIAVNQGSFSEKFKIESGPGWKIEIMRD